MTVIWATAILRLYENTFDHPVDPDASPSTWVRTYTGFYSGDYRNGDPDIVRNQILASPYVTNLPSLDSIAMAHVLAEVGGTMETELGLLATFFTVFRQYGSSGRKIWIATGCHADQPGNFETGTIYCILPSGLYPPDPNWYLEFVGD